MADDGPGAAPPEAITRWQDMRFGMFIHWGPVSITGEEISFSRAKSNPYAPHGFGSTPVAVYDNLYKQFNPVTSGRQPAHPVARGGRRHQGLDSSGSGRIGKF